MQEISLNILDIAQNSVRAGASLIEIEITEDTDNDLFSFSIKDNGCGMSEEMVKSVMDPFVTTRTTRRVGLGIPLLLQSARSTGGDVIIDSTVGVGTTLTATFSHGHIDRQPLGDISGTVVSLISMNECIDFIYKHSYNGKCFTLETTELKKILGDEVSLSEISVAQWIREYINESQSEIYGGADK